MRSVKEECLSRLILFGEASLRHALVQYVEHFHHERNHQGKGNVLLFPTISQDAERAGPIQCRERLGGLLKYYRARPHEFFDLTGMSIMMSPCCGPDCHRVLQRGWAQVSWYGWIEDTVWCNPACPTSPMDESQTRGPHEASAQQPHASTMVHSLQPGTATARRP